MTFQQLEYIVAVDKSRHFVKAATQCGVTQSTLSSTIKNLEQEIDVIIFDRSKHPIEPTPMGKRIIQQAEIILHNSAQLREMVESVRDEERGKLLIGMIPSVAPVIFPSFSRMVRQECPSIESHLVEEAPSDLIGKLHRSEIDIAILVDTDTHNSNLLTIDLWTERFVLYASSRNRLFGQRNIRIDDLKDGQMWTLRSFHDRYPQLTEGTHQPSLYHNYLDTGGLYTLVQAVDINAGYTLLPETYANTLSPEQRQGISRINSGRFFRTVTLAMRGDYMRERMLNIVTGAVKRIVPKELLATRIANFDKVKI